MELLVLGIGIMALGAAILHLAIEGRKVAPVPVAATRTLPRSHPSSRIQPAKIELVANGSDMDDEPGLEPEPTAIRPIEGETFGKADVLLPEALTELLDLKEQVSNLQARVDELTAQTIASKPASEPRHVAKQVRRRHAHGFA